MSDHLIAEANRHAMALPTTHPTHADIAWYVREVSELRAEVKESKGRERVAIASWDEERQRALREGGRVVELRAEVERLTARESNQSERIRYLEGATNHATGTPLSQAIARAERAEAELAFQVARNSDLFTQRDQIRAELDAERARLDAVVANYWSVHSEGGSSFSVFGNVCGDYIATAQTYRAAIDAAIKEGAPPPPPSPTKTRPN